MISSPAKKQRHCCPKPGDWTERTVATIGSFCVCFLCFGDHRLKSGLRFAVAVKQQRLALGSPRVCIIGSPESHHLQRTTMLEKCPENSGVSFGEFFVSVAHDTALSR